MLQVGEFNNVLLAGSNWNNGTNCRSQSRNANNYRWNTNTNISSQFLADPGHIKINIYLRKLLAEFINPVERQNTQRRECSVSTGQGKLGVLKYHEKTRQSFRKNNRTRQYPVGLQKSSTGQRLAKYSHAV